MSRSKPQPPAHRTKLKNLTLFTAEDELSTSSNTILVESICLPTQQPRRYFDPQKLAGLVESIRQHGILEPLLVRPLEDGTYELVAGERRYRAAKELGLVEVPVVIREMSRTEALQFGLIENLQREDLNPIEETAGILRLLALRLDHSEEGIVALLYRMMDEVKGKVPHNVMGGHEAGSVIEVFEGIGLMEWQSFVSNRLPLLKLPEAILDAVQQGKIAYTKAQTIARLQDQDDRLSLLQDAIAENLTLSQIKERIKLLQQQSQSQPETASTLKQRIDTTLRRFKQSKLWDDPRKIKQLEKLLAQIEAFLDKE